MAQSITTPAPHGGRAIEPSALSLRLTRRRQLRLLALAVPLVLYLLLVFGYPLLAFLSRGVFDPGLTATHVQELTGSGIALKIILITFRTAATVTLGCLLLGYPVAYLLSSLSPRRANLLMILVLVPFWTSILVRTYAWMVILGNAGLINNLLLALHLIASPVPLLFNTFSVHVGMIHVLLPFMVLTLYSVMQRIDRNLLRAGQSLGATPWQTFVRVFLPLSMPGVFGGCVLVFILSLGFYITPQLLGGTTDYLISMFITLQINELLNWGYAALLAAVLLVSTLVIFAIASRFVQLDRLYGGRT
ncbi:MAG TPA: ABC transporter permease [Chloroflexota bacterium]|nr:ABC transporter permease [Chloroflexota bacterium]